MPPDAGDSGKLLASPPSTTTQANFGRVKESTAGMTRETLNRDSIATTSCREGAGECGVLTVPFSRWGEHGICLLGKVAAWLQPHPMMDGQEQPLQPTGCTLRLVTATDGISQGGEAQCRPGKSLEWRVERATGDV